MVQMDTTEVTWYEDGSQMEYWETPSLSSMKVVECTLEDAIRFVQANKMTLVIQPALQDECIFADFTEEVI